MKNHWIILIILNENMDFSLIIAFIFRVILIFRVFVLIKVGGFLFGDFVHVGRLLSLWRFGIWIIIYILIIVIISWWRIILWIVIILSLISTRWCSVIVICVMTDPPIIVNWRLSKPIVISPTKCPIIRLMDLILTILFKSSFLPISVIFIRYIFSLLMWIMPHQLLRSVSLFVFFHRAWAVSWIWVFTVFSLISTSLKSLILGFRVVFFLCRWCSWSATTSWTAFLSALPPSVIFLRYFFVLIIRSVWFEVVWRVYFRCFFHVLRSRIVWHQWVAFIRWCRRILSFWIAFVLLINYLPLFFRLLIRIYLWFLFILRNWVWRLSDKHCLKFRRLSFLKEFWILLDLIFFCSYSFSFCGLSMIHKVFTIDISSLVHPSKF